MKALKIGNELKKFQHEIEDDAFVQRDKLDPFVKTQQKEAWDINSDEDFMLGDDPSEFTQEKKPSQ